MGAIASPVPSARGASAHGSGGARAASPVVNDVLQGFNGTILAYGQTGTGKTYTMGILERVRTERAGIIPRSLAHIFSHVSSHPDSTWTVTMSFLQIYLETIQVGGDPALPPPRAGDRA